MKQALSHKSSTLGSFTALFEVIGVFIVGSLLANILISLVGFTGNPLNGLVENPDINRFELASDLTLLLILQYTGWFVLVLGLGFWQKRQILNNAGLTTNQQSFFSLVRIGLVGISIVGIPVICLSILDNAYGLGTTVPWREALFNAEWDAGFWTIMFIGSFGLIPVLEELFFRGYMQSKLQSAMPPGLAIILTSIIFTLSHSQYHQLDFYNIATVAFVFLSSVAFGYVFYKSGSIIPAITMHIVLNTPLDGIYQYAVIGVMLTVIALSFVQIRSYLSGLVSLLTDMSQSKFSWLLLIIATGFMIALGLAQSIALISGIVMFLASIALTFKLKRAGTS